MIKTPKTKKKDFQVMTSLKMFKVDSDSPPNHYKMRQQIFIPPSTHQKNFVPEIRHKTFLSPSYLSPFNDNSWKIQLILPVLTCLALNKIGLGCTSLFLMYYLVWNETTVVNLPWFMLCRAMTFSFPDTKLVVVFQNVHKVLKCISALKNWTQFLSRR